MRYQGDDKFGSVTLELSLKPFVDLRPEAIQATCDQLYLNWEHLLERADSVQLLLWVSDGNEIFEWRSNYDDELIWCSTIGFNNFTTPGMFPQDNRHYRVNKAEPFMDNPPAITFRHLKDIIACLRRTINGKTGKPVTIGAPLDPGPEFAPCRFKIQQHPEVLTPEHREKSPMMMWFMTHQATLHTDSQSYAGFPDGIPEGTRFGEFLGKQFAALQRDLGYDYIWFSNGFAYSHFPWGYRGEAFQGDHFSSEIAQSELAKLRTFWQDFRAACPDCPIEVRGTNFTVGMDISAHGASHDAVAEIGNIKSCPPNPPWGSRALGLEMCSYLSRISKNVSDRILFRFYLNDVWFRCNAWYDYYDRQPFDIYCPMAAARIETDGTVTAPNDLAVLTVDTEMGELLRDEAAEATPHFIRALDERPDAAGPLTWIYPWEDYHAILENGEDRLGHPSMHDWFMVQCLNAGLPLNTIVTGDTFTALAETGKLPDTIFFAPVPDATSTWYQPLIDHIKNGGKVMLYGSLANTGPELLDLLGLELSEMDLEGEFDVKPSFNEDDFAEPVSAPTSQDPLQEAIGIYDDRDLAEVDPAQRKLRHRALTSDGGLRAITLADTASVVATAKQGSEVRAYAVNRALPEWQGGRLTWLRGTVHYDPTVNSLEPFWEQSWQVLRCDDWSRYLLREFGWDIVQNRDSEAMRQVNLFIKRHNGGFWFAGHKPCTVSDFKVRTPYGAPVYAGMETRITDGFAQSQFGKTIYSEVRAFVETSDRIVQHSEVQIPIGKTRQFCLGNLKDATVRIFPPPESLTNGSFDLQAVISDDKSVPYEVDESNSSVLVRNYTGSLYVIW